MHIIICIEVLNTLWLFVIDIGRQQESMDIYLKFS